MIANKTFRSGPFQARQLRRGWFKGRVVIGYHDGGIFAFAPEHLPRLARLLARMEMAAPSPRKAR